MSLRKSILLSLFACTTLQAAEFPNGLVPADVAAEFAGGGTLHPGLPDDFPQLMIPAALDLRVVGTHQRSQFQQTILLRSTLDPEELSDRLVAALTVQGWQELTPSAIAIGRAGYLQLCHDTHGSMTVSMTPSAAEALTRVQVQRSVYPVQFTPMPCADQLASSRETAARYAFFSNLVPVLEVPEGTLSPRPAIGIRGISGSFSGSNFRIEREGTIEVPETVLADVNAHFTEQLVEQGWENDSSAIGELSATSTWTRTVTPPGADSPEQPILTLTILPSSSEDLYGVVLVLRSLGSTGSDFISGFSSGFSSF